jgi:hypothetical protein
VAVLSLATCSLAMLLAGTLGAPSVGAGPPAFVPGEATAAADTMGLKLALGNANIGYTLGRALAHYQERSASADGRAIDLEALPTLFGDVGACDGSIPFLPTAALPPETSVESEQAGSDASHRTEAFFPEIQKGRSTLSAGFQDARANGAPYSWAGTETPMQDVGIFSVWNGRAQVTTQLVGNVRSAVATTTADAISFLGGTLVLYNPKWEAIATSGAAEQVKGTFDISSAKFFGVPRTASQGKADLQWLGATLQQLLGFVGARLELPRPVVDGASVEVTPLVFSLVDMPIGRLGISPIVELFRTSIETYYQQLRAAGCAGQSQAQLYRLVEGIATGNGSVKLSVGGVSATTDDTYYPALELAPPDPPPTEPPPPTTTPVVEAFDTTGFVPATPAVSAFEPADDLAYADPVAVEPEVMAEETVVADESDSEEVAAAATPASSRRRTSGDTGGAAALIGSLGVVLAVVLAAADRLKMLRGRRRVIE